MNVFITGATGYIGFSVAQAFRRAGHQVWGLTRSAVKAMVLEQQEIRPVIGSLQQPESYEAIAGHCTVLIHCAADYQHDWAALERQTIETLLAASQHGFQPKTLVYTSGSWIYGDTHGRPADETTAPVQFVLGAQRPEIEQLVLCATQVRGLVMRPAMVYGERGGLTGAWFAEVARDQALNIPGNGRNHLSMVHVEDLAQGYVRVVESNAQGEIFNFADQSRSTLRDLATAAARAAGFTGQVEFMPLSLAAKRMGLNAEAYALDSLVNAGKAHRLLGWEPKHYLFIDEVGTYFKAWQAWQDHPFVSTRSELERERIPA
jgi:nucleoside-diphosphate-sugar epimerase